MAVTNSSSEEHLNFQKLAILLSQKVRIQKRIRHVIFYVLGFCKKIFCDYLYTRVVGYSDFHNLMGFTSKKMPNNTLKNFFG
jgi:hypothetical protein